MTKGIKPIIAGESPDDLIEKTLAAADEQGVSDIHIEGTGQVVRLRFRIDGMLQNYEERPFSEIETIVSRLKVACQLDVTQRAHPQDGHFSWRKEGSTRALDVRVSFFPALYGETVVLRLLNRQETILPLDKLAMNAYSFKTFQNLISRPYGMILVSGPVGSGKSTTLYSILNAIGDTSKNIMTLEDPVEYFLPGIRQSQVSPERGFSFAEGLRAILRQDPNVVMVGEIRDAETAETAIRASITGILLLSTLHANNAVGTIARLIDMQLEPALIAYSMLGAVAQRLARKICPYCRVEDNPPPEVLQVLGVGAEQKFFKGKGCANCHNTGYKGRIGVYEVLEVDDDLRRLIIKKLPYEEMITEVVKKGMITLRQDALAKAAQGLTSIAEVVRVSS